MLLSLVAVMPSLSGINRRSAVPAPEYPRGRIDGISECTGKSRGDCITGRSSSSIDGCPHKFSMLYCPAESIRGILPLGRRDCPSGNGVSMDTVGSGAWGFERVRALISPRTLVNPRALIGSALIVRPKLVTALRRLLVSS